MGVFVESEEGGFGEGRRGGRIDTQMRWNGNRGKEERGAAVKSCG
jgi:hypothetical protein